MHWSKRYSRPLLKTINYFTIKKKTSKKKLYSSFLLLTLLFTIRHKRYAIIGFLISVTVIDESADKPFDFYR